MTSAKPPPAQWRLRLYVAGQTPRSIIAVATVQKLCDERLAGSYQLDVIDVAAHPELVHEDQIAAVPALVRRSPSPVRRACGDFAREEEVRAALGLASPERSAE